MRSFTFAFTTYANYTNTEHPALPNVYNVEAVGVQEAFDICVLNRIGKDDEVHCYSFETFDGENYNISDVVDRMFTNYVLNQDISL